MEIEVEVIEIAEDQVTEKMKAAEKWLYEFFMVELNK